MNINSKWFSSTLWSWRRVQAAGSTAGIFHAGIRHPRHKMDKAKIVPSRLGPKILKLNYPKFSYDLFLMSLKFDKLKIVMNLKLY